MSAAESVQTQEPLFELEDTVQATEQSLPNTGPATHHIAFDKPANPSVQVAVQEELVVDNPLVGVTGLKNHILIMRGAAMMVRHRRTTPRYERQGQDRELARFTPGRFG